VKLDYPAVKGGESPYLQQQNFSLAALAKRDREDPFSKPAPAAEPAPANQDAPIKRLEIEDLDLAADLLAKELREPLAA
jgi:hypothetical protein